MSFGRASGVLLHPTGESAYNYFDALTRFYIDEPYTSYDSAPTEAIVGAWQVDAHGNLSGEFIPNPYYRPPGPWFRFDG